MLVAYRRDPIPIAAHRDPFRWSAARGALALPLASGRGGGSANAVSNVRTDGTRLVAGTQAGVQPVVWVVRNPSVAPGVSYEEGSSGVSEP